MKHKSLLRLIPARYPVLALLLFASLALFADHGLAQTPSSAMPRGDSKETPQVPAAETVLEVSKVLKMKEGMLESDLTERLTKVEEPADNDKYSVETLQPELPKKDEAITGKASPAGAGNVRDTDGGEPEDRYAIFLLAGVNIPHDDFSDSFDPSFSFNGGVEFIVTNVFSVEGIFGYNRFRVGLNDHANLYQFSGNGKLYLGNEPARLFVNAGGGVYNSDGSSTRGGVNVGGGLQVNINPKFAVEGAYNFHNVFTSGSNVRFSTVQGGVRFRF